MDRETQAVSTAINTLELTPGQISFIKAKLTQIRDDINKILDADIDDIGGATTTAKEVTSIREVTSVRIQTLQRIQQITRVIEQRVERIETVIKTIEKKLQASDLLRSQDTAISPVSATLQDTAT